MKRSTRTVGIVTAIAAATAAAIFAVIPGVSADDSAVGATAATKVTIGTHNVLRGAATFHKFAAVIGWQEVNDPADRKKMRRQLGDAYAHYVPKPGPAKAVPISWRKSRFKLIKGDAKKTHGGEAKVTPARYITWVFLMDRTTKKKFIVVNTHFISGAWSKHPNRQARWLTHYKILKKRLATFRKNHPNKPIFVVGDFNRRKAMSMPSPLKYVKIKGVKRVPLDHMYAPSTISHSKRDRLQKWGSDHFAYKMTATF